MIRYFIGFSCTFTLIVILGACQSFGQSFGDTSSGSYAALDGRLTVNQRLPVNANSARVNFQDGQFGKLSTRSRPWCALFLNRSRDEFNTQGAVEPGEIKITHTYRRRQYAGISGGFKAQKVQLNSDLTTRRTFTIFFELQSDRDPRILQLECSRTSFTSFNDYPTLEDIRIALGTLVTIQ